MSLPASILIIDDDRGTRETVADILGFRGYLVETAERGEDGLEKVRTRPFDATIVDIKLPDISGLDLLKALKEASPETEVIFITGYASLQTAIQAIDGAAFAYLVKPFEMDHLLATLAKALEKQRLTRALRESEERYRLITENVNDAIFLIDLEGRILFSNRRGTELTGYHLEEFRDRPIFSLLTPEGAQQAYARLQAAFAGQGVAPFFEAEVIRKDGSRFWAEVSGTNVVKDGQVLGRLAVARDITERKRLREQLVQAEKLATLGQLIAGIAHELNNPLAAMVGHAQMLRLGQQDPKVAARADRIVDAAQRATRIVRNFLTVARRHHPERVAVSVNEIVTKTLELLAYQLRVGNVEVESALAPDLPQIAGDPHQLQQVVLNLVNNAIQAMAPGGQGRLGVTSSFSPDRSTIRLAVTDNGPGIPPEHLPRVLEPFFTTKPQGEGTGLGLAIAQGIVTDHGGIIAVESTLGQGATFTVTLPATAPPATKPAPPPAKAFPKGLRVLVVDDEAGLREMMAEALTGKGARVEIAGAGREALQILARAPVDVLVLDVRMPEVSGPDLWRQINQTNPALARRTVFCTGDVIGEETQALISRIGCPSVSKPFEWSRFFEAVAEAASR